ncbi:type II toxin-antitoxin system PemK/MazF family toxin [Pseudogulbenkiania ferrooxidans]|uniref:type II toxin-antitoxin system PemK/MazF family toxin n=1 Tax=Pseudogulbenkiania ferrooxidans TaxID=549169 RepID=UPI0002ED2F33|nr:type II toxin-antitoxin system PemK/MazF family toxin [Pseudogulbenkiania ferrooxidans]
MFNPGDIIHLNFDPAAGREMKGPHFGLVISLHDFNQSGMALVCPITQGSQDNARTAGFAVSLMGCGTETQGIILSHQSKTLDWRARGAKKKESVPDYVLNEVLDKFRSILPE